MAELTAKRDYLSRAASEVVDFGRGLWHGAIESPVNGAVQVLNQCGGGRPELHLVDLERLNHSSSGIAGTVVGKALDFYLLSRLTGGLGGSGYVSSSLRTGAIGAAYIGLLEPTDPNSKHFFKDRAQNAAVALGTFAGMGAGAAALDRSGLFALPATRSLAGSLTYGGIAGLAGGVAHAEVDARLTKQRWATAPELFTDGLSYGLFGAAYGGVGYGFNRLTPVASRKLAGTHEATANDGTIAIRTWRRFSFLPHARGEVDPAVTQAIHQNADAVVRILPFRNNPATGGIVTGGKFGGGTGFFIDKTGTIATAKHVMLSSESTRADGAIVQMRNGNIRIAEFVNPKPVSNDYDVELLRISPQLARQSFPKVGLPTTTESYPAVKLASDAVLSPGESVVALGFANRSSLAASPGKFVAMDNSKPLMAGGSKIADILLRSAKLDALFHPRQVSNINVSPGDSGGPLIRTKDGTVIGVLSELWGGDGFAGRLVHPQQGISEPIEGLKQLYRSPTSSTPVV